MAASSRAALLTKAHQVLKKHYKPVKSNGERSLLEQLLYACCLENTSYDRADEMFAKLQQLYFDWNEVRVTTVGELAEVMAKHPHANQAAAHLKQTLQSVFETHYSFDIDPIRKQTVGKAVKELEEFKGVTPFSVAYATQHCLGGHAIPVDDAALETLAVLGVISEKEKEHRQTPGLERAIPKNKGVEFASLLHQLAADFYAAPNSSRVRSVLAEIDPEVKSRLSKRSGAKSDGGPAAEEAPSTSPAKRQRASAKKKAASDATASSKSQKTETKKSSSKKLSKRKPR